MTYSSIGGGLMNLPASRFSRLATIVLGLMPWAALGLAPAARADDAPVPGSLLMIKPRESMKFVSKAPKESPFSLPTAPDSPLLSGATLRVFDSSGVQEFVAELPSGQWTAITGSTGVKGYKYKGAGTPSDPCKQVTIKPKRITAHCLGSAIRFVTTTTEVRGVRLEVGAGLQTYCTQFDGEDASSAKVFKRKNAPAPTACPSPSPCVQAVMGDNSTRLQIVLNDGNDLVLCPGEAYQLAQTLRFGVAGQEIYTLGEPVLSSEQARLDWTSTTNSEIVVASYTPAIALHHVTIDGNRDLLGYDSNFANSGIHSGAMVDLYGSASAYIGYNNLIEPRGWSALHVFTNCNGTRIEHNQIGPAGQPGGTWADGISYDCHDGEVANNVITDATDGGIVVFGGAGSRIHHNVIRAETRTLLGGINMVDPPSNGFDYTDTEVDNNQIISDDAHIEIGIGMGKMAWSFCSTPEYNSGAIVHHNSVSGTSLQFGYVLNGVSGWQFHDNTASASFTRPALGCNGNLATPRAFACQQETVNGGVCPAGTDVITLPTNLDGVIVRW